MKERLAGRHCERSEVIQNRGCSYGLLRRFYLLAMTGVASVILAGSAMAQIQGGFGSDSDKPIEITADSLEVLQKESVAIFSGKVVATQGATTLKSDKMKVFYAGTGKEEKSADTLANPSQKISKIVAEGSVQINSKEETAKGKQGIYDVNKSLITLSGDVILTKGKNVLKGEKFEYDMKSGKSRLLSSGGADATQGAGSGGRVKGLFVPEKAGKSQ